MRTIPPATDAAIRARSRSTPQEDNSNRIGNQQHRTAFVRRARWHGVWQYARDNITCLDLCEQTWGADTEAGWPEQPCHPHGEGIAQIAS